LVANDYPHVCYFRLNMNTACKFVHFLDITPPFVIPFWHYYFFICFSFFLFFFSFFIFRFFLCLVSFFRIHFSPYCHSPFRVLYSDNICLLCASCDTPPSLSIYLYIYLCFPIPLISTPHYLIIFFVLALLFFIK